MMTKGFNQQMIIPKPGELWLYRLNKYDKRFGITHKPVFIVSVNERETGYISANGVIEFDDTFWFCVYYDLVKGSTAQKGTQT